MRERKPEMMNSPMKEPSVLDYVKSRLMPWKYPKVLLPEEPDLEPSSLTEDESSAQQASRGEMEGISPVQIPVRKTREASSLIVQLRKMPWSAFGALFFALSAQASFAPRIERSWLGGTFLLLTAISLLILALRRNEWDIPDHPDETSISDFDPPKIHLQFLLIGGLLGIITFISLGKLRFSTFSVSCWLAAIYFSSKAFWCSRKNVTHRRWFASWWNAWRKGEVQFSFTFHKESLLYLTIIFFVLFFRLYRLESVPPEMNSDHAEKILDSMRVLNGEYRIFFPNNGGREPLQMYLVAAIHNLTGIDLGFMALKLVSVGIGLLTLPLLYLIGKEVANKRVGWLACAFAGIAYWPNVVSRFGLRLPFYMLFTATTMYFLLRGLHHGRRNDFIYAGISLGASFYGYSADRLLPLLVLLAVGLFLLHIRENEKRLSILTSTLALIVVSLILFFPLGRYILEEPQSFFFRTLTRVSSLEHPLPGPAWEIFLKNLGNAFAMFSWSAGNVWPISIPGYPALDIVCGGIFYLGLTITLVRYFRGRQWSDLFLILSLPTLLMPSVLALAFPAENPNLYRTGGAMVVVFLFIGIALDGLHHTLTRRLAYPWGKGLGLTLLSGLFLLSSFQNYDWVFTRYSTQYAQSAWNSSEMGMVIRSFSLSLGHADHAWVVGYPHWVDTRLVGINAGFPEKDYKIFPDELEMTLEIKEAKLFLVNPNDSIAIVKLKELYPGGWFQLYDSKVETKDFLIFFVPPEHELNLIPEGNASEANDSPQ